MKNLIFNLAAFLILGGIAAGVIFGLAGRWDLWNIWAYVGLLVVGVTLADYRRSPDALKGRSKRTDPGRKSRGSFFGLTLLQWIIVGLDQRFHWSNVIPPSGMSVGLVIFAVGWGLYDWAKSVNPFFQEERGQRVISDGPYSIMRHPANVGFLLVAIGSPLALDSLLAFIPTVFQMANLVTTTTIEDRRLHNELAGYADYVAKVRYRLIPGIW
jgi:protein-S-isoprenylcysteine O-methyltransferase Ste14